MLNLLILVFGFAGLIKGEFQVTRHRRVYEPHGRIIGGILLLSLLLNGLLGLVIAIVYGLIVAKPVEQSEDEDGIAPRPSNNDFKYKEKREG